MRTLLVTNDFPPKVGGIQSYLGELWARIDPSTTAVLSASSDEDAVRFDAACRTRGLDVERVGGRTLYLPTPTVRRAVARAITRFQPDLVLYDPFFPLALAHPRGAPPYGVVLHGAEVAIPGRVPGLAAHARRVLRGASVAVCAGTYPHEEARRIARSDLHVVQVPPGVDVARYAPSTPEARGAERSRLGVEAGGALVASVGRLVPRKGIDVLIEALGQLAGRAPRVVLAVAGAGRDERRLQRIASKGKAEVRFLGRVDDEAKIALLGAADLFAQPCRSRWHGLEQEGFGIVFLEAAACGVPAIAGRSGGSFEAVDDGTTGLVVDDPRDPSAVARALGELLGDPSRRAAMGAAARRRAIAGFDYDDLARTLTQGLDGAVASVHSSEQAPRPH